MSTNEDGVMRVSTMTNNIRKLLTSSGMSQDSVNYCLLAIDPFHDTAVPVVGCPDAYEGRSLVYDIRKTYTINKPAAVVDGTNWDCHMAFVPYAVRGADQNYPHNAAQLQNSVTSQGEYPNYLDATAPNPRTLGRVGLLMYHSVHAGIATFDPSLTAAVTGADPVGLSPLDGIINTARTKWRVIAGAYEVHNTTSSLNKQGSVTCYRCPAQSNRADLRVVTDETHSQVMPVRLLQGPPSTLAYAQLLSGVTWEAAQGALVPWVFDMDANVPQMFSAEEYAIVGGDGTWVYVPAYALPTTDELSGYPGFSLEVPFAQSGSYFTGLSSDSTLTLTTRMLVEVFPDPMSDLFALSRPSPGYDPNVERVLDLCFKEVLSGYPVGMNAKGDFFMKMATVLGKMYRYGKPMVNTILSTIPDPRAKAALAALKAADTAGHVVVNLVKESKKKPKNKLPKGGNHGPKQ